MIEPVDPFERGELDVFDTAPRPGLAGHFCLEQAEHGLGHSVIVGAADAPDRERDLGIAQALGIPKRQILGGINWSLQHLEVGGVIWDDTWLGD